MKVRNKIITLQDLQNTDFCNPLIFASEGATLEVFKTDFKPSWACLFALTFNGIFKGFKTFSGLKNASTNLIAKHNLKRI